MYALLGEELVQFLCDDEQVEQLIDLFFLGWPGRYEETPAPESTPPAGRMICLDLRIAEPAGHTLSGAKLIFQDDRSLTRIYEADRHWYIDFRGDALAAVPFCNGGKVDETIHVWLAPPALGIGRLEDIIFSSLAPALRRRGLFMTHAFAAMKDGEAVLLVGEAGSGKTTTGLSLVGQGWRYLANDVVLVSEYDGKVYAWPTPGVIGIDSRSHSLLADLVTTEGWGNKSAGKTYLPAANIVNQWGKSAPITKVLYPRVDQAESISLSPIAKSVALARLMESSVDRWDTPWLDDHMRVLGLLGEQATTYEMHLDRDLRCLPAILMTAR